MAVISVHDDDELKLAGLQLSGKILMESTIRAHVRRTKCRRARLLVARASKTMIKKKAGHIMKSSGPIIEQPLYTQLESLRNLVPYSNKRENSCVIADAMAYLDQLTKQLDDLAKPTIQVKVEPSGDGGLRIHLSCKKKPGLMATLLALLEGLGLVFENLNVSTGDVNLTLDALTTSCSSTTVGGAQVSAGKIKMILLRTLLTRPRNDQRQLNINSPTAP